MTPNGYGSGEGVIQTVKAFMETEIAWQELPEEELIAIFVPELPEPRDEGANRARSSWARLHHDMDAIHPGELKLVTYEPSKGMTNVHEHWIDETPTVLVVISEFEGQPPDVQRTLIEQQHKFARDCMSTYHRIHEGTEPDALIILYCGREYYWPPESIGTCYRVDTYDESHWPVFAKLIFNPVDEDRL